MTARQSLFWAAVPGIHWGNTDACVCPACVRVYACVCHNVKLSLLLSFKLEFHSDMVKQETDQREMLNRRNVNIAQSASVSF